MGVLERWRAKRAARRFKELSLAKQLRLATAERRKADRVIARHSTSPQKQALLYAQAHVGITENPPGSNRGKVIDQWQREVNMIGQPWCGAFVHACLNAGGVDGLSERMRFCPFILEDAKAGHNGLAKVVPFDEARAGDVVLFNWDGGAVDHVGLFIAYDDSGNLRTVEGNTSPGAGGSQSNGGGVFNRVRSRSVVAAIVRPKY